MNDYFQHLIDRSTNQTPAIRPGLPSLYESPDFHAFPVIADLAAEIIDHPREKTARIPVIRPGLPSLYESPDFHASPAIADLAAETIHNSREKIAREINVPVLSEALSEKETFPEKLIRGNVSENHKKDIKDTTSLPLHTPATGTFANETIINMVSRKTVLKNALHTPASPDRQPSAVSDSGANQKPETQPLTGDKAKKAVRQFSPMEPAPALHTSATDSKQTHVSPAGVGKQPKIRPLIATQAGPQISPPVLPQQAPPEKTIKVTIGRIEVRAVMPQAPSSRPQTDPKETQPKISLEDYLKKQRGGSR